LNLPFFCVRSVVYLSFWTLACEALGAVSRRLDRAGDERAKRRLKTLSSALLPPLGLTLTFAAFDWVMALSPDWYSTMFGVYFFAGGFVAAIATVVVLLAAARRAGHLLSVGRAHNYALGRLLLAFVVFWAYVAYFQYFLIWIANRPLEARWYVDRLSHGYGRVGLYLLFGHFIVPFLLLLSYGVKQRLATLVPISVSLIFAHYIDIHWLIAPARGRPQPFSWQDLAALLAVGGLSVAFGVWRLRGHLLAPVHDPSYERSLHYESQ
jgi:hypothetical protein